MNTIPNQTFVINAKLQAIEIPKGFNQILHYDVNGKCVEFSSNQRYLAGGLNAGVVTDSRIFYTSVPEEDFSYDISVDLNTSHRHNKSDICIKALPKDPFKIPYTKAKIEENHCTIEAKQDYSYVINI